MYSKSPEKDLASFFKNLICHPPKITTWLNIEPTLNYICQLSDFYYMLSVMVTGADRHNKAGGVAETRDSAVNWCQGKLQECDGERLKQFLSLPEIMVLSEKVVKRRLSYSDQYTHSEDVEHGVSGSNLLCLSNALNMLKESVEGDKADMDNQDSTVNQIGQLMSDMPVELDAGTEEQKRFADALVSRYVVKLENIKPALLLQLGVPGSYAGLYQCFISTCLANLDFMNIGTSSTTFYFTCIKCLGRAKGIIVFLNDLFVEHSQFNDLAEQAKDQYDCLLIDNQNISKTRSNVSRPNETIKDSATNIALLLRKLGVNQQITFIGVGYGALLALELTKIMPPMNLVVIDLPTKKLTVDQEAAYKELAKTLSVLMCHGAGWLDFDQKQSLRRYLDLQYKDSVLVNETFGRLLSFSKSKQNCEPQLCLQGYLRQIEAMQSYSYQLSVKESLGYFSSARKKLIINLADSNFQTSDVLGVDLMHTSYWPFKMVNLKGAREIIEKDTTELWSIICHYIQS